MEKNLNNLTKEELILKIKQLQKEKKLKHKYGLVWDTEKEPEQVVELCKNNIPILKNIKSKDIKTDNSQDNILIEGDNYLALQVLNYTHKNKIDVIYIDPPYNTGNKDFSYNDKFIDKEDGYRHSKWLNFMSKRLELARNLLTENGVIFISIDDNEQANLKLLCDKIFGENNFVGNLPRVTKKGGKSSESIQKNHDYILIYFYSPTAKLEHLEHSDSGFKYSDKHEKERGKYKLNQTLDYDTLGYVKSLDYPIIINNETFYPGNVTEKEYAERKLKNPKDGYRWRWSKDLFDFGFKNDFIVVNNKTHRIYTKTYQNAYIEENDNGYFIEITPRKKALFSLGFITNEYSNDNAKKELKNIIGKFKFDYPKPSKLIADLLKRIKNKDSIILDFFAGSGTTAYAILDLNKQDGGNRKFILCTNNENSICTDVCYPRIQKVINGYNKNGDFVEGLGGNLKYFKTDLISVDRIDKITDYKRKELTQKAGEIIGIKEDTLQEIEINNYYQILSNNTKTKFTAIYFRENEIKLEELISKIKNKKAVLYVFSYGKVDRKMYKELSKNITIEDIPQPILDIYKELNLKFED